MNTHEHNAFPVVTEGRVGEGAVQTVNARDLHAFLRVGSAFKDWIARRIEDYGFQEGKDFCSFLSESSGGRPSKEYAITLDMAKELSMVERNDQGKKARQYFIDCEKRAQDPSRALADPAMLRHLLLENVEKVLALEAEVKELTPLANSYEFLTRTDGTFCITDAAKAFNMRPKDLFAWLQANKWIYRRAGNGHWVGYQQRIQGGFLDHRVEEVTRADGSTTIKEQVRVTSKGMAKLGEYLAPVEV